MDIYVSIFKWADKQNGLTHRMYFKQPFFIGKHAVVLQLHEESIFIDFTFTETKDTSRKIW